MLLHRELVDGSARGLEVVACHAEYGRHETTGGQSPLIRCHHMIHAAATGRPHGRDVDIGHVSDVIDDVHFGGCGAIVPVGLLGDDDQIQILVEDASTSIERPASSEIRAILTGSGTTIDGWVVFGWASR